MDDERFWSLIEPGSRDVDPKNQLRSALQKLTAEELVEFQERFDAAFDKAHRWPLWAAASVICGSRTDDGFTHFRYGLILRGRKIYEAALRDPDSLAYSSVVPDPDGGYLALDAYEAKTGGDMPRRTPGAMREPEGSRWDLEDPTQTKRRLPKLVAKHRGS